MRRRTSGLCASFIGCALACQFPPTAIAKSHEATLHSFSGSPEGAQPRSGLVDLKGVLYGTTPAGGTSTRCTTGCGTVFALDPATGAEAVLYSFCSKNNSKKQETCEDGQYPAATMTVMAGRLYGVTEYGGEYGAGTVFRINPRAGSEKLLYSFKGHANGYAPDSPLIDVNGTLYGTTLAGGTGTASLRQCPFWLRHGFFHQSGYRRRNNDLFVREQRHRRLLSTRRPDRREWHVVRYNVSWRRV